jgi:small basic protein
MIYAIIGLIIGIVGGLYAPGYIPKEYAAMFSGALMAGLDTAFGGLRAALEGAYDNTIFLSGFLANILLAMFFCYAGVLLGIDFYMVVILVLGMRIFQNLAIIRRLLLKK